MSEFVVTVTPTICDGTVVRWYRSLRAAENCNEAASASRNGYHFPDRLSDADDDLVSQARAVYATLKADNNADVKRLATHRAASLLMRDGLVPVDANVA